MTNHRPQTSDKRYFATLVVGLIAFIIVIGFIGELAGVYK
jgi:hypothetical protein